MRNRRERRLAVTALLLAGFLAAAAGAESAEEPWPEDQMDIPWYEMEEQAQERPDFSAWGQVRLIGDIDLNTEEKTLGLSIVGWTLEDPEAESPGEICGYRIYALTGSGKKAKKTLLGEMEPEIEGSLYFYGSYAAVKNAHTLRVVALNEEGREMPDVWAEIALP